MRIETDNLNKRFGGVVALDNVSLDFPASMVTAIIGPNGAGKTTLFNVMAGFLKPDSGSVFLVSDNKDSASTQPSMANSMTDVAGLAPHQIAGKGVGVLFQDVRVFKKLSAIENVAAGVKNQRGEKPLASLFRPSWVRAQEKEVISKASELLEYVGLADKGHLLAEQLSYGQQKLVAIARLLAGDAKVLLLDEPTSGVHPDMVDKLLDLIQRLADNEGRVVVLIEHDLNVVKRVGDWVYLMASGRVEVFGPPKDVLENMRLQEIFPTI
jgi:ABC-type branched-subunit amino acid transport system ATPase component